MDKKTAERLRREISQPCAGGCGGAVPERISSSPHSVGGGRAGTLRLYWGQHRCLAAICPYLYGAVDQSPVQQGLWRGRIV